MPRTKSKKANVSDPASTAGGKGAPIELPFQVNPPKVPVYVGSWKDAKESFEESISLDKLPQGRTVAALFLTPSSNQYLIAAAVHEGADGNLYLVVKGKGPWGYAIRLAKAKATKAKESKSKEVVRI